MKYGLNALRDFMDFIPSFCRTQNVVKNISSNRLTCVSPLGMRSKNRQVTNRAVLSSENFLIEYSWLSPTKWIAKHVNII